MTSTKQQSWLRVNNRQYNKLPDPLQFAQWQSVSSCESFEIEEDSIAEQSTASVWISTLRSWVVP